MKKVEVYFLINLGAILSIFAIEGELGEYMRRQNDILLEVAKDKLEAMVSVDNVNSLNSDSLYKFTFKSVIRIIFIKLINKKLIVINRN